MIYQNPFVILPLTGLLIGWITNYIAIKLLFFPRKKTFGIQGLIPKRKEKIAERIAEASLSILPEKIDKLRKIPFIGNKIENYIKTEVAQKIKNMDDKTLQEIVEKVAKKELFFIEISGAIIGFLIGIAQAVILGV
ncbi:DUF445 family protein [Candidatus Pacearchaeota archaeon]|nr:DUF445 family protein [Candidatus Pacearchaeota archaeon]